MKEIVGMADEKIRDFIVDGVSCDEIRDVCLVLGLKADKDLVVISDFSS